MGKIGFVGFGNMGGTMIRALLKARAIPENNVMVFTRTKEKLKSFVTDYPKVEVASSLSDLGLKCKRVFICTGTREVKSVLTELNTCLCDDAHVISIAGTLEMKCLGNIFKGRITKIMPTMISEVREGVTLVYHNNKALPEDKEFIRTAFGKIGRVKEIREAQFDLAGDLTSCAPAFYAAILNNLVKVAKRHGDFKTDELNELILPTCYGTTKLLLKSKADYNGLISRVATKGGISEEGVKILDRELPKTFDELLNITLSKREKIKKQMREHYGLE
jgi:pyrroline-5-carboxylate reductase